MLWVVLDHIVERLVGGNFAGDPTGDWPSLQERVRQFAVGVHGLGPFDWPLTVLRDVGWLADQAVGIFIVLSGFGLALGLSASHAKAGLALRDFYRRRLERIYPYWWGAHILFLPTGYLFAAGMSTGDWQYYASFIGLRSVPDVFYYFSSSWWYVGVILQLYLAFPLLWWILRTYGARALIALTWTFGFAALAFGHAVFHGDLVEMWQRGICAVTRLPEFAFGMVFAVWWARDPARGKATLQRPVVRAGAALCYAAAFALSFTLPGMIVAPTLLAIAAIVLLYPLVAWRATGKGGLEFVGRHSFTIYLTHQFIVTIFVRPEWPPLAIAAAIVGALATTAVATYVLEVGTGRVQSAIRHLAETRGRRAARLTLAGAALALVALPLVAELLVRAFAPLDSSRWSERVALQSDPVFGWRFVPSRTVHLHGRADYRITSNAEGFPGPGPVRASRDAALRVLVVGDAVSSAGVDTNDAWPTLLQRRLTTARRPVEVANFAVSGYGPNQEAPVALSYLSRIRPDVVLVEVEPDDVEDVLTDTATLREEIGLSRPAPDDPRSVLALERLRRIAPVHLIKPIGDAIHARPSGEGYALGEFVYLERGHDDWDGEAVRASARRYGEIARAAARLGARTVLVFVPAPSQVCGPRNLAYYPEHVPLDDPSRYDVNLPNRRVRHMAAAAALPLWDLTPALQKRLGCPYGPYDTYLRPDGQRTIAEVLAPRLLSAIASRQRGKPLRQSVRSMPAVSSR